MKGHRAGAKWGLNRKLWGKSTTSYLAREIGRLAKAKAIIEDAKCLWAAASEQ